MSKIKETVTALTTGNETGAVHINRKEHGEMSDRRFEMLLECIVIIALIIAGTVLIVKADIWKLVLAAAFGIVFSLIYFGLRN